MTPATIIATLVLSKVDIPAGAEPGPFEVTLFKDGVPSDPVQTADGTVTFTGLDAGTYTATARRLNVDGTEFSPATPLSDPIVVEPNPQADAPASITLTLG